MPMVEIIITAELLEEEAEEFEELSNEEQEKVEQEVQAYLEKLVPDDITGTEEEFAGEWHYEIEVTVH